MQMRSTILRQDACQWLAVHTSKSEDILIVDDEADIRALVAGILEDEGYEAREAARQRFRVRGRRRPPAGT